MNKVIIVETSNSDRRLMSGLLTRAGYELIVVEDMEVAKPEVTKLSPGAVIVSAMKFRGGTAKELINWLKEKGYKYILHVASYLTAKIINFIQLNHCIG